MDTVRLATPADLPRIAALAASLVRFHHGIDPQRFFLPERVEEGYRMWLGRELSNADAIVMVAGDGPAGYLYGRLEPRDWNMLLDRHAALHDVFVDERARGSGVAEALVRAFADEARRRGAPRIVLHTATTNAGAQALFAKVGFRPTMLEMTLELAPASPRGGAP
jgi:ribosomal protein S18 acetylase RimI-like enzyme